MRRTTSLRLRLFALILIPLVLMALLLGFWRVSVAQRTAEELFDRSLLAAALAISRDAAVSGGDLLQPLARELIHDASGGEVFYHATGPGGTYVTGYAYPPNLDHVPDDPYAPFFSFGSYRDEDVRVLRITERITIQNLTGDTTVTVWQRLADRNAFANQLAVRAAMALGALLVTLALVVWFGVARGLRPLIDLQQAIAARSPGDLSQIKRPVPIETQGIVSTLNRLFSKLETTINAHQTFISDASHQLRNPVAAVQSMAESVRDAPTPAERDKRIDELVVAARSSARVTHQLLSMDRLHHQHTQTAFERINLSELVQNASADMGPFVLSRGVEFELDTPDTPLFIKGDAVFLTEAVKNLIDNALQHGGDVLGEVKVTLSNQKDRAIVTVSDDGKGLSPDHRDAAFGRFSQVGPSNGSGLGLAIVASVAEQHNGSLEIDDVAKGASLSLSLPIG